MLFNLTHRPLTHRPLLAALLSLSVVLSLGSLAPAAEEPAPPKPDPYAVPDGTPAELAQFIKGVMSRRPPDQETFQKARKAVLEAADKILAAADKSQVEFAVQVKVQLLADPKQLEALAEQLEKDKLPKLARTVRGGILGRKVRAAMRAPDDQKKKLIGQVKEFLAEGPVGRNEVSLAMTAGRVAEMSGNSDLAVEAYTSFGKLFAASEDPEIAGAAKRMEGIVRRLTLVGKPVKVEGTVFGGDKLDWNAYKGKVVLVDFWATWCGPCVAEVPNMKKNYELYHDRGFEIIGIAVNERAESLEAFIKQKEIPWTIVYSEDDPSPTPDYYGVTGIPTMILVGADGKVVSTTARGPQLEKQLEKLLGPAEKEAPEEESKDDEGRE